MTDLMERTDLSRDVLDEDVADMLTSVDSIYRSRYGEPGFEKIPWCAYFYYVGRVATDGTVRPAAVYQYISHQGPIERSQLRQLVTQLALNARAPADDQNPKPSTAWFPWRRKSYIIMLVDDPSFSFDQDNAIAITERVSGENYTFFDGVDFNDIALPGPADGPAMEYVTAVCFTNHMKRSAAGDDLGDDEEQRFTATFSPPLSSLFVFETAVSLTDDSVEAEEDHGTNMGPPIGPP